MTLKDRMTRAEDYVFGLMDEHERQRAERDLEVDAEFRDCVMQLAERLRRLREQPRGPISITDNAWHDITRRIASMPQMMGIETAARMAGMGAASPDPTRKGLLRLKRPYAHQFGGARGVVVAAVLAAALAVGFLTGQATGPARAPQTVAVLSDETGAAGAVVEAYADGNLRILPLVPLELPAGKVLQLWIGGVPSGVLERVAPTVVEALERFEPQAGTRYEITLEDAPGATDDQARGPVMVSGEAVSPPR